MKTIQEIVTEIWPGWRLENQIGAGAYGEVYRAVRTDMTGETVSAIKVIKIRKQNLRSLYPTEEAAKEEFDRLMRRFSREIQIMRSVKGQTNVVSIEDYSISEDQDSGVCIILIRMEYLTSLLVDLDVNGWNEKKIIRIGTDICRGLEACEKEHIAHRDIKPENILLNSQGDFKLGDFGVARTLGMTQEAMTGWEFARWEPFIAPEVKNGQLREADFRQACRVDIYALGMLMYWLANGQRFPFLPEKQLYTSQDRENAEQRRLNGEELPGLREISPELNQIILKACAFDSNRRYEDAKSFREALEGIRRDTEKAKADTRRELSARAEGKKRTGRWLAAVAACIVLIAGAVLWLRIPVPVRVDYVNAAGELLGRQDVEILPGTAVTWEANFGQVPEGYTLGEPPSVEISADLLRRVTPARAVIQLEEAAEEREPETLEYISIWYPHVYASGQPLSLGGEAVSPAELTEVTVNLYTPEKMYTQTAKLAPGTTRFDMKELSTEIFTNLDEGTFWLEIVAADAAGRVIGFSHTCSASYLAEEHTMYELNRAYAPPELRGSLVYAGHTYELYRLPGGGWDYANSFAQGKGGHLVSFQDAQEFSAVASYCLGMGVKYINTGAALINGEWVWTDGTPFTFHPWRDQNAGEEPAYPPVGCMLYTSDQEWKFSKATQFEMAHFLMEYDEYLH